MNREEVKLSHFEYHLSLAVCFILRLNLLPAPKIGRRFTCSSASDKKTVAVFPVFLVFSIKC